MVADVTIRHCRLKVVRRGGWSWGMTRQELARAVAARLPQLILQRIADCTAGQDIVIADPVKIALKLRKGEFQRMLSDDNTESNSVQLSDRIDEALLQSELSSIAIQRTEQKTLNACSTSRDVSGPGESRFDPDAAKLAVQTVSVDHEHELIVRDPQLTHVDLLASYYRKGTLAQFLRHLTLDALWAWEDALVSKPSADKTSRHDSSSASSDPQTSRSSANESSEAAIEKIVAKVARSIPAEADLKSRLCCRIFAATEVLIQTRIAPGDDELRRSLDHHIPKLANRLTHKARPSHDDVVSSVGSNRTVEPAVEQSATEHTNSSNRVQASKPTLRLSASSPLVRPNRCPEHRIDSVLPFLVLQPLARVGVLDAVSGALHAAGMDHLCSAFASTLAYKVLDPPERGWRRPQHVATIVAAFNGTGETPQGHQIEQLVREAKILTSTLEAVLAHELLGNHSDDQPLYLTSVDQDNESQMLLVDPQGCFPVAIVNDCDEQLTVLDQSNALLIVDETLADRRLLNELNANGCRFLIDVPPVRDENYRRVKDRKGNRFWSNDAVTASYKLARQGSHIGRYRETVKRFWTEIGVRRIGTPIASDRRFENSLSLLAGVGLAQVAWDLWRENERTDPLLPLQRFADLGGVVRLEEDRVQVRLPLGRRSMDLAAHGYLDDIQHVPWFNGQSITFSQG